LDAALNYRIISTTNTCKLYQLNLLDYILHFTKLIGAPIMVGIWKRKPKLGSIYTAKANELINVLSKADIYVSHANIRLRLHAYCHVVGVDACDNVPLLSNLCAPASQTPAVIVDPQSMMTLRVIQSLIIREMSAR
jgi:hypothetical protein